MPLGRRGRGRGGRFRVSTIYTDRLGGLERACGAVLSRP